MAKTPGQNNNQEEGPPDLDELLNDLRKKIGRIFGKKEIDQKTPKSSGGNPTPNSGNDQLPIVPILLIVVLLWAATGFYIVCLLYTSPSPRDRQKSRMPSSA